MKWTSHGHAGWSGNTLLVKAQIVLAPPPPIITLVTLLEVVRGFIVQLIVRLSLAPSEWNRVRPSQFNG